VSHRSEKSYTTRKILRTVARIRKNIKKYLRQIRRALVPRSILSLQSNPFERVLPRRALWLFITSLSTRQLFTFSLLRTSAHPRNVCLLQIILSRTPSRKHSRFYTVSRKEYYICTKYLYRTINRPAKSVSTITYTLVSREYWCAIYEYYYYYYYYTTQQWRTRY